MLRFSLRSILRRAGLCAAACPALLGGAAALAETGSIAPIPVITVGEPLADAPALIIFSRAADLSDQRKVYFSRASVSGPSAVVAMSSIRRPAAALRIISAPVQRKSGLSDLQRQTGLTMAMARAAIPSQMPVAARALTSAFGMRNHPVLGRRRAHLGIDLAAAYGSPIVATSDGEVSWADWAGGYGLAVAVDHGGGFQTRYGHMSRLNVVPGQHVRKGEIIGFVGSTGLSTGPHLHYEVRVNGQPVNPMPLLGGR